MHPFKKHPLALLVAAACSASVGANETTLKDTVVTATLTEHDTRTAPASVSVVTREELETRNAADLLDAVRGTPGITLSPRSVGGRKTLALRGLEGKHTLTLIDGRRISPSDDIVGHSDYQYGWLPVSAIERVEVIRGPMSTLYGSEALGGVINLITRQPKDRWIGSAMLSGSNVTGSDGGDGHRASVFAAGPAGERLSLRFTGETANRSTVPRAEDPRQSEIEGSKSTHAGVGATLALSPHQSLEATVDQGNEERFYDTLTASGTIKPYENRTHIDRTHASLAWKGHFDGWRAQARAYYSEIDVVTTRTNGVAPTRPQNMSDRVVDGFAAFRLGGHQLTVGGEFREETLENDGLIGGKDDATHQALFAQDEVFLADKLALTAGLRIDHHEIFGTETSPRAYLVWEASPQLVIKGGYGHAFKAPTLKQISPSYVGAEGPHTFMGNASIKPEKSDSLEIAADWKQGPLSLRGTLFHNEVEDLITYRLLSVSGTRRTYLYDNVNKARITGLETGFSWDLAHGLALSADLTLLRTKDKDTGKELANRPETTLASRLDWQLGGGWSARAGMEYNGRQLDGTGTRLPGYTLWNASVGKKFDKTFSVRAGVNNLTDVRLAEKSPNFGYAETGRALFATLRADF